MTDVRYSYKLSDIASSSQCETKQMKDNQESSTSSLNLAAIPPLTFVLRRVIKLPLNKISIFLLIDHQTISASEKKKSITHSYLHILKIFVEIIVKYLWLSSCSL